LQHACQYYCARTVNYYVRDICGYYLHMSRVLVKLCIKYRIGIETLRNAGKSVKYRIIGRQRS
jgi:hypothetical protein